MSEGHKTRRRWFRFSLRTLMLWVIPYAAILAWIVSWRDMNPPTDDIFADALGDAMVLSIKIMAAFLISMVWVLCLATSLLFRAFRKGRAGQPHS